MTLGVFFAVLVAAFLHASWNALIKFGGDKLQGMCLFSLGHIVGGVVLIAISPAPLPASWGWLALSVIVHLFYQSMLTLAYQRGDLSRVYPIARGSAPVLVLIASVLFLTDPIDGSEILGVLLVSAGIGLMAWGVFAAKENRALIGFALLSACATAAYSISDGMGARASASVGGYLGWMTVLNGIIFILCAYVIRGRSIWPQHSGDWSRGLFAGALSLLAYLIAVWAMTQAPIALVTALRETSVMFAVLLGIFFLGERADIMKWLAVLVILCGVVLVRV